MTASAPLSLGYVAVYVALVGVASSVEKPAGRGFGAFQLNALIRVGSLAAAAVALLFGHGLCVSRHRLPPCRTGHWPSHRHGLDLLLLRAELPARLAGGHAVEPVHRA